MLVGMPPSAGLASAVESRICLRSIVDGDQEPNSRRGVKRVAAEMSSIEALGSHSREPFHG